MFVCRSLTALRSAELYGIWNNVARQTSVAAAFKMGYMIIRYPQIRPRRMELKLYCSDNKRFVLSLGRLCIIRAPGGAAAPSVG